MSIKRTIITTLVALAVVAVVAPIASAATVPAACTGVTFSRNLKVGSVGSDVKCLQALLNTSASTQVATVGAGSPGHETTTFGPATLRAVKAYQVANGLTPAVQVGPQTRALLNAWLNGSTPAPVGVLPVGCTSTVGFSPITGLPCNGVAPINPVGPVSVTVASDNPPAGAIVGGQAQADLLHLNFTGTGTVTSLTLQRSGISDSNLFSAVYLYDNGARITGGYSFGTNSTLTMNGLSIAVSGSHVISVRGDVASQVSCGGILSTVTSCESTAAITATGFVANATTVSANVMGNTMSVASGNLATAKFASSPAVNADSPAANPNLQAGTVGQTLWTRTLNVTPRAILLYGLTVKQIGSAPSNALANVGLFVDGTQVRTATINSNMQFVFDASSNPITLTTGSHTVEVRGDVVAGSSRSFYLSLEQGSDVSVKDSQLGVFLTTTDSSSNTVSNVNGGNMVINGSTGGSVTVAKDPAFGRVTTLVGGASNVTMASFKVTAYGEDEKITELDFTPSISGTDSLPASATTLTNVGLYVNEAQIGSNQTATTSTLMRFTSLGSNLIVPAGTSVIVSIKGDVIDSAGYAYTTGSATFNMTSVANNAQGQGSSQIITVGGASGQSLTISSASTVNTFGASTSFAAQSVAPASVQQRIGSFTLQTGSAEGVSITSVSVDLTNTGSNNTLVGAHNLTNLTVRNGSTVIGTVIGNPSAGANNFSVTLPVGVSSSVAFDVYADIGSNNANAQTATPSMQLTYRGQVSNLSTTTSLVKTVAPGNAITVASPTILYSNIKTVDPTLTAQFVTGNGSNPQPLQVVTFNVVASNQVGGGTLQDLTFLSTANTIASVIVGGKVANVDSTSHLATIYGAGISVPAGTSGVNIPVSVQFVCVGTGCAGTSNTTAQLSLTKVTYNDGTQTNCIGATCATPTTAISAQSAALTLVGSIPTVSMSNSTSSLLVGSQQIGTFTIAAGSTGDIKVEKIPVQLNLSTVTLSLTASSVLLKSSTGGALNNAPVALNLNGTSATSGTFDMSANPTTISAGNSVTYTVWVTTSGTLGASGSSSLSFSLGNQDNFKFTDVAGGVSNIPGTAIANYPQATQTRSN